MVFLLTLLLLVICAVIISTFMNVEFISPSNVFLADICLRILLPLGIIQGGITGVISEKLSSAILLYIASWIIIFLLVFNFTKYPSGRKNVGYVTSTICIFSPNLTILTLLAGAFVCFFLLFVFGSYSAVNWILDPRQGYQFGRVNVGIFYAGYLFFLNLSFILFLFLRKISLTVKSLVFLTIFLCLSEWEQGLLYLYSYFIYCIVTTTFQNRPF